MPLPRGARLSSRNALAQAQPHRALIGAPPSFFRLAAKVPLSMYGNDQYGDCVTAEEYSAKAAWGIVGTNQEAIDTARKWGGLNGADLATILDYATHGFTVGGAVVQDGVKQSVNYCDYAALCNAIYQDQVKIAVGANALESAGAGSGRPWIFLTARMESIDHCIGLAGYGTLAECCAAIGLQVPAGADPTLPSVVAETWSDYGVCPWEHGLLPIMDSTPDNGNSEAWIRMPNTVNGPNPPPPPGPPPVPPPTPGPGPCPWRREDVESFAHDIMRGVARALRSLP